MKIDGSKSQLFVPVAPGVLESTSALPLASLNGPVGESLAATPTPLPLFPKYRKNLAFRSMTAGAQESPAQLAKAGTLNTSPWSVQFLRSLLETQMIDFIW